MGILDFFKHKKIKDNVFGNIKYDNHDTWTGKIMFAPVGHEVFVYVQGDVTGPYKESYEMLHELYEKYEMLLSKINSTIFYNVQSKINGDYLTNMDELLKCLKLDELYIYIGSKIDLHYGFDETILSGDYVFTVHMEKWEICNFSFSH
ncbi:hypothetical protein [Desulfatibacillum aliphaticivorans]|uniref:hypothetical protein n=1 Tax=Desulfatibacillum aliphaticivorans TaxID=218208 RepID=UPI00047F4895|nr:hypothetical protein [Desulfatibacillum aliphaticivorans]